MSLRRLGRLLGAATVLALAGGARGGPLTITREVPGLVEAKSAGADYTGDGVDELMAWWSPYPGQMLTNGVTGEVLRRWDQDQIAPALALLPDESGDGRPEFLFTVPQAYVKAVASQAPGGPLPTAPGLWTFGSPTGSGGGDSTLGLGENIAVTGGATPSVLIGHGSGGRLVVADPATGATLARISRDPSSYDVGSFGELVADVGDLNADGVHDFAVGGGPRYPTQYVGQIFLLNGRVRTTPTADVPVTQLPQGDVLGVVQSFVDTNFGNGNNALVSLGDPNPRNGVAENLLLVGTPIANYSAGGAAAVLLTGTDGGPLQITEVARWAGNLATKQSYGRDVADIGDVNGDGVDDAAILEQGDGSAVNRGRILIVSGAGLLDGFSSNDVIQQIDDPKLTFSPGMSFLGDYDHDGRGDLAVTMSGPTPGFVRIYSVPEPTSVAAAAFASAALLLRRRRRCRHGEPSR